MYIEHPIREEWLRSQDTSAPATKTSEAWQFRIELTLHVTVEFPVIENRALMDSYQISALTPGNIDLFVSQNYIDATTRAELDKLIALKARIAESNLRLTALKKEMQEISDDQKCLRENIDKLKSTPEAKQLITRYIAKADAQETRLEQIAKETKAAEAEQERLQTELAKSVKEFKFERKL